LFQVAMRCITSASSDPAPTTTASALPAPGRGENTSTP
jgi:hypothetical protein